ncbi:MAG: ATP-binding protein, partial [Methanosarcinales archaeon]|nr:ATP-binding protein [Methanosarcinales archaeon]
LVDLNEKQPCAIFIIGKERVAVDDSNGTLLSINQIIVDAESGVMPPPQDAQESTPEQPDDAQTPQEVAPPEPVERAAQAPADHTGTASNSLLDLIQKYVGDDVMQVFGDTGTGKSKFALEVAREAIAAGKKVYYLDTERNLTTEDIASLQGCEYKYTPVLDEIDKIVQNLPVVDVVILDSIGFPVLTSYARLSMKQKGDALLKLIAIFGDLKIWAYRNNGVAVVTNQPESEFGKEKGHIFRPFGDKSQFACKEIWKTEYEHRSPTETKVSIKSFRSRSMGQRSKIASLKITDAGVEVIV